MPIIFLFFLKIPKASDGVTGQIIHTPGEDVVDLEPDLSSTSSQPSLEDLVPDMLNSSFGTLHHLASMSNQDKLIFGN